MTLKRVIVGFGTLSCVAFPFVFGRSTTNLPVLEASLTSGHALLTPNSQAFPVVEEQKRQLVDPVTDPAAQEESPFDNLPDQTPSIRRDVARPPDSKIPLMVVFEQGHTTPRNVSTAYQAFWHAAAILNKYDDENLKTFSYAALFVIAGKHVDNRHRDLYHVPGPLRTAWHIANATMYLKQHLLADNLGPSEHSTHTTDPTQSEHPDNDYVIPPETVHGVRVVSAAHALQLAERALHPRNRATDVNLMVHIRKACDFVNLAERVFKWTAAGNSEGQNLACTIVDLHEKYKEWTRKYPSEKRKGRIDIDKMFRDAYYVRKEPKKWDIEGTEWPSYEGAEVWSF
jgi:hypothetical protein